MRDFDAEIPSEEDRKFIVGGQTFVLLMLGAEALAEFDDEPASESFKDGTEFLHRRTKAMLSEDDQKRWDELTAAGKISHRTLRSMQPWIVEIQTGRPTQEPSGSSAGAAQTGGTSKGSSSSEGTIRAA